ncbi:hypothetical protein [Mesorhizobium escarrei]|uniref:Uncharacterized protein n=1 Tax=Mesorhizobium escarrei TaxID=666018 RepID=A0ABN8KFU7_9HYPH|nr:hypothetical protein [Mesorhizobium escarrei]CAH2408376.1 hypothetical protein MES5069_680081 [Mesorhizobium escarrei]
MTLFNGMLCAVGDKRGCDGVKIAQDADKIAQDADGRWWRSKDHIGQIDTDDQSSFSTDQALGVYLYLVQTGDKPAFARWLNWIKRNPHVYGPQPSYCTHKECLFKALDCPLLVTVAAGFDMARDALEVCSSYGVAQFPDPGELKAKFEKARDEIYSITVDYVQLIDELAGRIGLPPGLPNVEEAYEALGDLEGAAYEALDAYAHEYEKFLNSTVAELSSKQAQAIVKANAGLNESKSMHLAGVAILLLRNMGYDGQDLSDAAAMLSYRRKFNPFYEYLENGPSGVWASESVKKCPSKETPSRTRLQWFPERDEGPQGDSRKLAWEESMYWDCIFLMKLNIRKDQPVIRPGKISMGNAPFLADLTGRFDGILTAMEDLRSLLVGNIADVTNRLGRLPVVPPQIQDYCQHNPCPLDPVGAVENFCAHNKCPKF